MSARESDDEGPSTPKKKRSYKQKFRNEWSHHENFKKWLRRDMKDPYRAYCIFCDTSMTADMGALKRHSEGNKHVLKAKPSSSLTSIATAFKKPSPSLDDKHKIAEIKLAAFMTEHKISHRVMDHLVELLPKAFPDSEIAQKIKMKRTKLRAVINNVLGTTEQQDLCTDLKRQKFSVMIDESTDIAAIKTMCVVVRYFCPAKGRIVSRFWDLIQIYGNDNTDHSSSAERLFDAVLKSFQD
ncbi:unnamed protein product [Arctia plantaginis]|uniref:Uncharacterized protein n=1 Tax=Arctia plantaginis TaxID=874455 RepID=A0A8S0Z8Y9_ARCPL|nr:unnamed protein product [Arctia plantaginis]